MENNSYLKYFNGNNSSNQKMYPNFQNNDEI